MSSARSGVPLLSAVFSHGALHLKAARRCHVVVRVRSSGTEADRGGLSVCVGVCQRNLGDPGAGVDPVWTQPSSVRNPRSGEVKMVDRLANSEANSKRIAVVEGCFGAAGQPLAIPGRVLIGEGVLTKLCRKKPKARQFFLFNDILVYGNIVIQKKKYNKQHIIPLESVTIATVPDEGDLRNGWLIKTPTKSFAVYAATATEKSEWMNHIGKCVGDLLQKSGKSPTGEHAAVWVPDSEATVCMRCQKVKFTPVSRRHHCRKCGFVVCGPCSDKKYLLPSQSSKPVRVCEYCFVQLTSGSLAPRSDSIGRAGSKFNNLSDDEDEDDSSD